MIFNKKVPKKNGFYWVIKKDDIKKPHIAYVNFILNKNDRKYVHLLQYSEHIYNEEQCLYGDEIEIPEYIFCDN